MSSKRNTLLMTALALGLATISADAADRSRSVTGPQGNSVTKDVSVDRNGGGSVDRSVSVQGSQGRGITKEATRTIDPETGEVMRDRTIITNSGGTITKEINRDCDRANGSVTCGGERTVTGPNGNTVERPRVRQNIRENNTPRRWLRIRRNN